MYMRTFQKGYTLIELLIVVAIIAIIATIAFGAKNANAEPVGIAAGAKTGTNYPMAVELANKCSTAQSPINVVESEGSGLSNINRVYQDKNSQYGIVTEDALVYQNGVDPKMMSRIVTVFPFFTMEIHLVAKAGSPIRSLADLNGKRVVEGPDGSSTAVTSMVIKAVTKGNWTSIPASQKDGIAMVTSGQADAMFIVAGAPVKLLNDTPGIKLVPISSPEIEKLSYYTKAMITSSSYPWQSGTVSTYKVHNLIVTYAFKSQYQKEIGDLVTCIARNVEGLQRTGHPKWRDVDPLYIEAANWPVHPAAVKAIKREAAKR
jgi:TRAP transporter TAXI family solute receptor